MYIAFLPINYLMMIACFYLYYINEIAFLGSNAFHMHLCMLVCMCVCVCCDLRAPPPARVKKLI